MTLSELLDNEDFRAGRIAKADKLVGWGRFLRFDLGVLDRGLAIGGPWHVAVITNRELTADWRLVEPEKE